MLSGNSGGGHSRPGSGESSRGIFGSLMGNLRMRNNGMEGNGKKKQSTTRYLAERHGIKNTRTMYVFSLPRCWEWWTNISVLCL